MQQPEKSPNRSANGRAMWLINHTTLREFEVPLLRSLGHEVYTSKLFPRDEGNVSASTTYEFDSDLTIPKDELAKLNNHDFYTGPVPDDIRNILNQRFEIVFTTAYPASFGPLLDAFKKHIVVRVFGRERDYTYARYWESAIRGLSKQVEKCGNRFWFGHGYRGIEEIEPRYLRDRSLYLPLGLSSKLLELTDGWNGCDRRLMFVCPRIKSSPDYYGQIYRQFKSSFNSLPHVIAGAQPVAVPEDSTVTGKVDRSEFDRLLRNCRVMFYHSVEPRHIHYHPLEAIVVGMPLIYMRQGVLGGMADPAAQPGACTTIAEAVSKVRAILSGDDVLVNQIKSAQSELLHPFSLAYNEEWWRRGLERILSSAPAQY